MNGLTLTSYIKVIVRVKCYKFAYISAILGPIKKNFDNNDGIVANNKNVTSSDLENVDQGHHL